LPSGDRTATEKRREEKRGGEWRRERTGKEQKDGDQRYKR
jgi:hypothetical protein